MTALNSDAQQMLRNTRRRRRRFRCRERTFQIIHQICKILMSIAISYGFVLYLATQDPSVLTTASAGGGFVAFIWIITLTIGAAIYGCDTMWTGVVYVPPGKHRDE